MSVIAPDIKRIFVKVAASIASSASANLHNTELAAKAIMARSVEKNVFRI